MQALGCGRAVGEGTGHAVCRWLPNLPKTTLPPGVVLVHTSMPERKTVLLGTEVNTLPAAIEAVRARGGLVVAQLNHYMSCTYGDAVLALRG